MWAGITVMSEDTLLARSLKALVLQASSSGCMQWWTFCWQIHKIHHLWMFNTVTQWRSFNLTIMKTFSPTLDISSRIYLPFYYCHCILNVCHPKSCFSIHLRLVWDILLSSIHLRLVSDILLSFVSFFMTHHHCDWTSFFTVYGKTFVLGRTIYSLNRFDNSKHQGVRSWEENARRKKMQAYSWAWRHTWQSRQKYTVNRPRSKQWFLYLVGFFSILTVIW